MAKLFYVIGSSGAGKDSIMNYAKENLDPNIQILFAHRYITRPANDPTENHISLSENEFLKRKGGGILALNWYSHGFHYGIGIEIDYWIKQGFNVVINGSREYLPEAINRYPELLPLMIEVSPEILRERLNKRGRESPEEIERRISRNQKLEPGKIQCTRIWNNSSLEESGNEFIRIISEF